MFANFSPALAGPSSPRSTSTGQVDPEAVGLYLQARALMHLYRSAQIDVGELVLSILESADHLVAAGTATSA